MISSRKRILVIKLSSLGDIFHALPAVTNLQLALDAEVDWVTQPEYVELVGCFPVVSQVIPFPRRRFWSGFGTLVRAVRARHYDYVIDLQGLLKSAVVARLARGGGEWGPPSSGKAPGCFMMPWPESAIRTAMPSRKIWTWCGSWAWRRCR